jgi:hypothetical protein
VPQDSQVHKQVVRKAAETASSSECRRHPPAYVEVEEPDMHKPLGDLERLKALKASGARRIWIATSRHPRSLQQALRKGELEGDRRGPSRHGRGLLSRRSGRASRRGLRHCLRHRLDHHRHASGALLSGRRSSARPALMNPQIRFGEDLMSRVSYVMMNPDGEAMTKAVREAINDLIGKVAKEAGVDATTSSTWCFVGNPIMHHLFLGIDPTELGQAPFALAVSGALQIWAQRDRHRGQPWRAHLCAALHRRPCRRGCGRRTCRKAAPERTR